MIGIERIDLEPNLLENLGKIGFVTNQAITNTFYDSGIDILSRVITKTKNSELSCIFGPQHGYYQTEQDNMIETPDLFFDLEDKKIKLYSLYSFTRVPTSEQINNIDTFVIDLPDIGARAYTYMQTLSACLSIAGLHHKKVIVLDRPNPLGLCYYQNRWHNVEGNILDLRYKSFVGWHKIPMRHGLSLGELGNYFIIEQNIKVDYTVITVNDLKRNKMIKEINTDYWTLPSPNMPSWQSAFLFPAFVTLEGTNVSEGRGTTLPFQMVGAPFLDLKKCDQFLHEGRKFFDYKYLKNEYSIKWRPVQFRPTFNKYKGEICYGFHFHILSPETINIFNLGVVFLTALKSHANFEWKSPGYEYNFNDMPYLLLLGHQKWENYFNLVNNSDFLFLDNIKEIIEWSQKSAENFAENSQHYWLYK